MDDDSAKHIARSLITISTALGGVAHAITTFPFRWVQAQSMTSSEAKQTADRLDKILEKHMEDLRGVMRSS